MNRGVPDQPTEGAGGGVARVVPSPPARVGAGHDLRLAPAAAAAWVVTLVCLGWSPPWAFVGAAVCAAVAVAVLSTGRGGWSLVAGLALVCAAVAAAVTGTRVHVRNASPLRAAAAAGEDAVLRLAVRDDPRPVRLALPGSGPAVAVRSRVEEATLAGGRWRLGGEVLVFAPATGWRSLLPTQRVLARGRLALPTDGDLAVAVLWARGPPEQVGRPSTVQRTAGRLRQGLRDAAQVLPPAERGLLPGLVLGDTTGLDPVVADDFRAAGLSHLLAVSGANLSITVGLVLLLARRLGAGPWLAAGVAGLALAGFVVLARPSPSVLRAAAMGLVALLALATGRPRAGIPALAAAVLVLVLAVPALVRSAGFALSVLATGGLLVFAPPWCGLLRRCRVPPVLADALAVSAAAQLATAPVVAALGGRLNPVAVPANLLAAPAVAPATVLGVLVTVTAPVTPLLAGVVAWLAGWPVAWLVAVARAARDAPTPTLPWPSGAWAGVVLAAVLVGALVGLRYRQVRRAAAVVLAVAVAALLVSIPARRVFAPWPPPGWLFVACDVGQGDALVVRGTADSAVVVDTGPDPVGVDRCLRRLGVRRVPLVVLTHLHADHVGGLDGVFHRRSVGAVEVGPLREPGWAWDAVRREVAAARVPLQEVGPGTGWVVGQARLEVLAPGLAFHGTRSDPNNSSLVLRLTSQGHTVLLTGDVEVDAQRAVEDSRADLTAEVLKVPHHGSAHSDRRFLAATHARIAVISVGADNDYGHPAPSLVAELTRLGMRVYRTDRDGDVAVYARGGRLAVRCGGHGP